MNSFEIEVSLFFFFLGWELVLIKKVDSVLYRPEFAVPVLRSEQKYGCFVPLQIPGRTGRFGKNTGYRPENENRPVKCKPTVKKKKRYPNPYCRFHFSGSDATSPIIVHLLFVFGSSSSSSSFVQSCSNSVSLLRALAVGLPYAKCKVHLAFKPKIFSATKRPNLGKAKFFWHSATVPS